MQRLIAACAIAAAAIASVVTSANAQGFPNQTIKIIVPFTPGGSNDVVAREIAAGLQARLKQTAVVENRPGGGGTIAYQFVAKSPADGHTMLIAPASFTMGPHLSKKQLYDPVKEFAAINLVADVPFVMVVPASLPVNSVQEFIALAKKSSNKLTFGSVGQGTPQHLAGELFKMSAGVDLIHVPFRGATVVLPDLIAGRIDMFIGAINSLLELIADGKLKALATSTSKRVPSLPNVPTMAEVGLPDVQVGSGVGLVAPAGTPPQVIATLNREITAVIADKGFHERMAKIGVDVVGMSAEAYGKFLVDDYAKWAKVVKAAGIEPQ
jgi:tripartite-type tricarboxylate transporter receptor subunit TctC